MDYLNELKRFYTDVMQSLSAFQRIVDTVNRKSDIKGLCEEVVKILSDELDLDHCSIMLLDETGQYVVNQAGISLDEKDGSETFPNRSFKVGEGVAGMVAQSNTPILITDVNKDKRYKKLKTAVDIGSLLCLPVSSGGKIIGVLNLSHRKRNFFSKHHEKVFSVLSATVGNLITFMRLQKDLERLNRNLQKTVLERTREIEKSHEYLKNIFENASDIIFTVDNRGRFTFLNKRVEDLGYRRDELVGKPFDALIMSEEGRRAFVSVLQEGYKKTVEIDLRGKEGAVWQTLCSFTPLKGGDDRVGGLLGVAKDITERKRLEKKLFQTEKLASMGTFVSGIAHELNNRLLPVLVYSELLQQTSLDENALKLIKTIHRSATGAKHIVESLLRFSRQEKPHKSYLNLNQVIHNAVSILHYRISSSNISLNLHLDNTLPITLADEKQMEQVFMNILNNACDALEEVDNKKCEIEIRSFYTPNDIYVEISNNGPPIPGEVLSKIFDPFYTSKDVGKGTGLGLSLCYGIIHEHGGDISVISNEKKTIFTIKIPIVAGDRKEFSPVTSSISLQADRRRKRILVVDDEEDQIEVMRHILKKEYHVDTATSGKEAIEKLSKGLYDLIICDIKMPDVDGVGVYEWIKVNKTDMEEKILFSTGDILGSKAEKILSSIGDNYILKPYNVEELLKKVSHILGGQT